MRRTFAAALAAALVLLSPGLEATRAFAQTVRSATALPSAPAELPVVPVQTLGPSLQAAPGLDALSGVSLGELGSQASLSGLASQAPALGALDAQGALEAAGSGAPLGALRETVQGLQPAGLGAVTAVESGWDAGARTFDLGRVSAGTVDATEGASLHSAPESAESKPVSSPIKERGEGEDIHQRSVLWTLGAASVAGVFFAGLKAAAAVASGGIAGQGVSWVQRSLEVGAAVGAATVGVLAAAAALDVALFAYVRWKGRHVTHEQFERFVERHYPQYRSVIRPYLPTKRELWFSFGFQAGSAVYLRRELIAAPWLFKLTLAHELSHLRAHGGTAPPMSRSFVRRGLSRFRHELRARVAEWFGMRRVGRESMPLLWRVLSASRVSWRHGIDFDVLAVDASDKDLPSAVQSLSAGKAKLEALSLSGSIEPLSERAQTQAGRYKGLILYGAAAWLPDPSTRQGMLLRRSFRQLDQVLTEGERRRALKPEYSLDSTIQHTWRQVMGSVSALESIRLLDSVYRLLSDRGTAVLPFSAQERGLDAYERLLRFYTAADGGRFGVTRVDLAEGGHVLVLRKLEVRVNLWVSPGPGKRIKKTLTNATAHPARRDEAWKILEEAGLSNLKEEFAKTGAEIRHVFGEDHGENRIYVSVPRANSEVIKRLAKTEPGLQVTPSKASYQPHLIASGPLMRVPEAWGLGYRGKGIKFGWVDTGLDVHHPDFQDRMQVKDLVNDGAQDFIGHGTHVAGISAGNGGLHTGMAPEAEGMMGKVFAQGGMGASDGDIMAALADLMDFGADVINLSLGSRGGPNDTLAQFVSGLSSRKNAAGRYPVVFASAGNSGPFHETLSQPSAGPDVNSVASYTKRSDVRLASFFSSSGFSWDEELKRWNLKPEFAAIGGNVTSTPDVYQDGVESVKSQHMPAEPSDASDGKHTRMSGTSMSAPMAAGVAGLALEAARAAEKKGVKLAAYVKEHAPLVVRAVFMRTAIDGGAPIPSVGAGQIDAGAAVKFVASTLGVGPQGLFRSWWARLFGERAPPEESDWDWVDRFEKIVQADREPFVLAKAARDASALASEKEQERPEGAPAPTKEELKNQRKVASQKAGDAHQAALLQAKQERLPFLLAALKDGVWVNRMLAAFALLNYRLPEAADALLELAVSDPDSRVRQMALRAVGNIPTHKVDPMLKAALKHGLWDVQLYAALALAQHGDADGMPRIAELAARTGSDGPKARFSAVFVAGEAASAVTPKVAEALAGRVADRLEIDSIRHHAAASLQEIIAKNDAAVSDRVVLDLLSSVGPEEMVLTYTLTRVFSAMGRKPALAKRLRQEPLHGALVAFVQNHRDYINQPGPLGELVRIAARLGGIRLDVPTPPMDPNGKGVKGVDPRLGPVQLYVRIPLDKARITAFSFFRDGPAAVRQQSAAAGVDPETVERHEGKLRATLPAYNAVTLEVPEARLPALAAELEARGFLVSVARPVFGFLGDTGRLSQMDKAWPEIGEGEGVTVAVVDEGGQAAHPAFKDRVRAVKNFTDEGGPEEVARESVGHGTHVGGIAAGESVEGSPYRGMAPKAKLVFAKVLGENGGTDVQVMEGQAWAASLSTDPLKDPIIINESLGGPGTADDPLSQSVNRIVLGDVGFVAAAGNSGPKAGTVGSPGLAALSTTVGAVDKAGKLTFYSSREVEGKRLNGFLDFGGGAYFGRENPYEIVSPLNTTLQWGDRATTVWWPDRKSGGKPLYQHMSGTSMAAPHTTGKMAVLVGRMLKELGGVLPPGYWLWLRQHVERTVTKTPYSESEAGAGLFNNVYDVAAAMLERLKNPELVREEAAALLEQAKKQHGGIAPKPGTGSFIGRENVVEIRGRLDLRGPMPMASEPEGDETDRTEQRVVALSNASLESAGAEEDPQLELQKEQDEAFRWDPLESTCRHASLSIL